MAFQTGTQVNAALGRTDYTPFLQGALQGAQAQGRGAENIAAGLAGLGQQVATGIEKYYKKQEEKKVRQQGIDFLVKNFGVDEKAADAGIGAVGAQAFASFLQNEQEKQKLSGLFNQTNAPAAGAAIQGGASFEQLPMDGAAYKSAPLTAQQFLERGLAARIDPSKLIGTANVMINAEEARQRNLPKQRDPIELARIEAQTLRDRAMIKKIEADTAAIGQPKPLTPSEDLAERKFAEEQKSKAALAAEAESKKLAQAAYHKETNANTIANIDKAINLYEAGYGGGIMGIESLALAKGMLPLNEGNDANVNSLLNSIKSSLTIGEINRMKEFSKTGATGFGSNFSDKEGAKVESNITSLDPKLNRNEIVNRLKQVRESLVKFSPPDTVPENKVPKNKNISPVTNLIIKSIKVLSSK
jgi:hypothetical protein